MPSSAQQPGAAAAAAPVRVRAPDGLVRLPDLLVGTGPARAQPWRHYWLRLVPALTVLTLLTRLPSFTRPLWNPDEGFLATQAQQLADGGVLYDTVVDRKPPLLPWLYRGGFALFGDGSLWPLKAAAVPAVVATAVLVASLARRRWGGRAGWAAGALCVLFTVGLNPADTQAANFEIFMLPWTAAAMWCADRRRWAGAGAAVALAALTKQTGGAVLLPVLFLLMLSRAGWSALWRLLAAFVLPVTAVALFFGFGRFFYWTATGSASYASVDGAAHLALLRAAGNASLLAIACAPVLVVLVHVRRTLRRSPSVPDLWVWLAASGVAVTVGFQFYGHYYLQLAPPLALIGTAVLRQVRPRAAVGAAAASALIAAGFVTWGLIAPRPELAHAQRVAAVLREHSAPGEPVLVWGMHPEYYWLSDREPASRYLTAGFLTNFSGGRGGVRVGERYAMPGSWRHFRRDLAGSPPRVIVDDSRGHPYGPENVSTLRRYLAAHYEPVDSVDGAVIYLPSPDRPSPGRPSLDRPSPGRPSPD